MSVFKVEFQPFNSSAHCKNDESILECARQIVVGINNTCGGRGTCASCKIKLVSGELSPPTSKELNVFGSKDISDGWRLACQSFPKSSCVINVPSESLSTLQRIQFEGLEIKLEPDPSVKAFNVTMNSPTLNDQSSDDYRLLRVVNSISNQTISTIDFKLLQTLSNKLRELDWTGTASIRNNEIIAFDSCPSNQIGLAIDLGTTKIAGYIINLETGEKIVSDGILNPQILYGDDVISRITYALKSPEHLTKMQKTIIKGINDLGIQLCQKINVNINDIKETVIVCNTAMHHLLIGLPVKQLAVAPFIPAVSNSFDIKARDLGFNFAVGSYINMLPNIAGYVGSDHIAAILSTGISSDHNPSIILDIGTNTEISLIHKGTITTVSCASGPAFEGAHIKNGMRATTGAIEKVYISEGAVRYLTIGNTQPVGICGSGMLDTLAQMYLSKIIDKSGRISMNNSRVQKIKGQMQFVLVEKNEKENQRPIVITQKDIREIQLAKAAIRAAIKVLLKENSLSEQDIIKVVIAGAFGTYIDISSAIIIGLLPQLSVDKFYQVGNAAGMGAILALISNKKRQEAADIALKVRYIELADNKYFMKAFLDSSYIGY